MLALYAMHCSRIPLSCIRVHSCTLQALMRGLGTEAKTKRHYSVKSKGEEKQSEWAHQMMYFLLACCMYVPDAR